MSTTALLPIVLALCGLTLVLVTPILYKLYRKCEIGEITPEWLESFSASTYYPMQRLLADEDFRFLSRQPGFDFSLYRKLRRERLHIFQQYLTRMIRDFNRLHLAARVLVAHAHDDSSRLLGQLVWLKVRFSAAVLQAEISYVFCRVGIGSLAAQAAVLRLEEMSAQLSHISAAQAA
jgi:hypothetical protein